MSDNLTIFLLLVVAIGAAVVLTLATAWMRSQRGLAGAGPAAGAAKVALLERENRELRGQIGLLEERLLVLERIATDPAERLAAQIEAVR